ncbi:MAG: hypothetical protein HY979_02475 [Candidatus Magasanikbacteria bacterium]|nr:hypothetical protein [Candidatus Magasanikbacteria bacterium]
MENRSIGYDHGERSQAENRDHKEGKEYTSRVVLNFFRHGEKNSTPGTDELTKEGRKKAVAEFAKRFPADNNPHKMAFGSWIKRSEETAALALGNSNLDTELVDSYASVQALTDAIDAEAIGPDGTKGLQYGSKTGVRENLGFKLKKGPVMDAASLAIKNNNFLKWIVDESDSMISEDDKESWGLSRQAANIANEIKIYIKIAKNFDRLVTKKSEEGKDFGDTLERLMGSHSGVLESFLVKLIQKTKGEQEKEKFVNILPEAFNFLEGFSVEIENLPGQTEPKIRIKYERKGETEDKSFKFNEVVSSKVLEKIIAEGAK